MRFKKQKGYTVNTKQHRTTIKNINVIMCQPQMYSYRKNYGREDTMDIGGKVEGKRNIG
jgi:hypothetical protein